MTNEEKAAAMVADQQRALMQALDIIGDYREQLREVKKELKVKTDLVIWLDKLMKEKEAKDA